MDDKLACITAWCNRIRALGMTTAMAPALGWLEDCVKDISRLRAEVADLKRQIEVITNYDTATLILMKDTEIADLKRQLAEANHWLLSRETELRTAQESLGKAYAKLALAREENLSLRQREAKA